MAIHPTFAEYVGSLTGKRARVTLASGAKFEGALTYQQGGDYALVEGHGAFPLAHIALIAPLKDR